MESKSVLDNVTYKSLFKIIEYNQEGPLKDSMLHVLKNNLKMKGVDPNSKDKSGNTPLIYASKLGNKDALKIILDVKEVDVNAQNNDGNTALHKALKYNYEDIAGILICRGADLNIENNNKQKPIDFANEEMVKYIQEIDKSFCEQKEAEL